MSFEEEIAKENQSVKPCNCKPAQGRRPWSRPKPSVLAQDHKGRRPLAGVNHSVGFLGLYAGLCPLFHLFDLILILMFPISYHYLLYYKSILLNPCFQVYFQIYTHTHIYISIWVWVVVRVVEIVMRSDEMVLRMRGDV